MSNGNIKLGDLVRFDVSHHLGIVLDTQPSKSFPDPPDKQAVQDVYVYWGDGEVFWCLEFTLELISRHVG